jgi:hypothetical protein
MSDDTARTARNVSDGSRASGRSLLTAAADRTTGVSVIAEAHKAEMRAKKQS